MRVKVLGAAGGEVTGSAYLIQTNEANVLVDAGMFQGGKLRRRKINYLKALHQIKLMQYY